MGITAWPKQHSRKSWKYYYTSNHVWQSQIEFRYYTVFNVLRYSIFKVQKSTASIMLSLYKGFVALWMARVSFTAIDLVLIGLMLAPVSAYSHWGTHQKQLLWSTEWSLHHRRSLSLMVTVGLQELQLIRLLLPPNPSRGNWFWLQPPEKGPDLSTCKCATTQFYCNDFVTHIARPRLLWKCISPWLQYIGSWNSISR